MVITYLYDFACFTCSVLRIDCTIKKMSGSFNITHCYFLILNIKT